MSPGLYAALLHLNIETPSYFTVQETALLMPEAEVACRNFARGCMPIIVVVEPS
jgi:hypothetical protein